MVVIRGRLTPEVGAVVRRALEAALDEDRRAAASREPGEPDPVDEVVGVAPSFGQRQADALGMVSAAFLDARPTAAMRITSGTSGEYRLGLPIDSILTGNGASRKPCTVRFLF